MDKSGSGQQPSAGGNGHTNPLALLSVFEDATHAGRHGAAFDLAAELLQGLYSRWLHQHLAFDDYTGHHYPVNAAFCERFSRAWATLLLNEAFDPRATDSLPLLRNLQMLHLLVQGTAEGTLDTAIRALHNRVGGQYNALTLGRLALLWVPSSRVGLDIFPFSPHIPRLVAAQAVATIASPVAFTPHTHAAREAATAALTSGRIKPGDYQPLGISNDLLAASMRCSYSPTPEAHGVKRFLNAIIDKSTATAPPPTAPTTDGKPVMLVPLDAFASAHAMYRCYGPVLDACRARFTLVALAHRGALDAEAECLFDVVHELDSEFVVNGVLDYRDVMRAAMAHRPAIVFYPSVGMSTLTLTLALRRLAPIQAMTYGHPETTFSPAMDFGILEEQWVVDPARYTEQIITVPRGTLRYTLPADSTTTRPARSAHDDVLRIAVPSVAPKWTWPFIEALQQVAARTGRQAEFHFFSGFSGTAYAATSNAVQRLLANAIVHPTLPYEDYRRALARCHLHAGTFPFGGTNSIIDSLLNGLPVVCMRPIDARGAQDADFVERAGLPAWLVTPDVASYIDTLVRLCNDRELLASLHTMLADGERTRSVFLTEGHPEHYVDALLRLLPSPSV